MKERIRQKCTKRGDKTDAVRKRIFVNAGVQGEKSASLETFVPIFDFTSCLPRGVFNEFSIWPSPYAELDIG